MQSKRFFATLMYLTVLFTTPLAAIGTTILGREAYNGPVVDIPESAYWQSEAACLRAAIRDLKRKTCLEVPSGNPRDGEWVLVTKRKAADLKMMWQAVEQARQDCESRPSVGNAQSQEHLFFEWAPSSRECLHISHDNRDFNEPWL